MSRPRPPARTLPTPPVGLAGLTARWRADAAVLRRRGAEAQAQALESCVADVEDWAQAHALETLTLAEAARECGFSYSALQKQVGQGKLPNAGTKHRPRVRRGDLPRKGACAAAPSGTPELAARVLAHRAS